MKAIGAVNALYPTPTTIVGCTVNGKPNFLTIAHIGILNHGTPQYLSIGLGKVHYSNAGIMENKTFSICLPSEDLMVKTDYCGLMTGKKTDKAALFHIFYGELKTAPLIRDCPLSIECKLVEMVESGPNEIFIGEIKGTYTEERFLTDGKLDFRKMKPLILSQPDTSYWRLGEQVARAWNIGKKYKAKLK